MPHDLKATEARRALRVALAIASLYAVAGIAWILGSDALVQVVSTDPQWLNAAQRYKGMGYVLVSALGLGLLIHHGFVRWLRVRNEVETSELRVQDLFLKHPQPMWLYDRASLTILQVNDAAIARYGHSREVFLGMTVDELRAPDEIASMDTLVRPPQPGTTAIGTIRHRASDGEVFHVQVTAHPLLHRGRQAVMVLALDVTEEVTAKQALAQQQAQFRQLHASLGEVLWLASLDGAEMLYVSPAIEVVYGVTAEQLQREPTLWWSMIHPDDQPLANASNERLRREGQARVEYRIRRADGEVRWIADRKSAITDKSGRWTMIGGIAEDITTAKQNEGTLRRQTEELAQRNEELERFNRATVGRELDMIRLKQAVNVLARRLGEPEPHALAMLSAGAPLVGGGP